MYISGRERKILEILLSTNRDTTFQDLAEDLDVSIRTIQRDIKGIETILIESGLLLSKKPGNGLKAIGSANQKEQLLNALNRAAHTDYTTEERHVFLLARLLQSSGPIKQNALANELKVSLATIGSDLDKMVAQLQRHELKLIKKRGYGVEILGSEKAKRQMMSSIIHQYTNEIGLLSFGSKESVQKRIDMTDGRLLGLVSREKIAAVERTVMQFIRENNSPIADRAYTGLIVHLALAIERVAKGNRVAGATAHKESLGDSEEYVMASSIMAQMEKEFGIRFPDEEVKQIAMHLMGAKALVEKESEPYENPSLWLYTQKLIALAGSRLSVDFANRDSLYNGLMTHLKPAIYRMEEGMGIQNPLLPSIKKEYSELFGIVKDITAEVFPNLYVPDEEIGYLVMHFASALLMTEEQSPINALVVCTSGIGTSKILTATIQKEFPEVASIRNVSAFDISSLPLADYDLIVSTVHLDLKEKQYLLVNPFLTERDITEIRAAIQKVAVRETISAEEELHSEPEEFLAQVQLLSGYSETIGNILEHFSVVGVPNINSKEQVIHFISSRLAERGLTTDAGKISEDLLLREQQGGTGLPETGLALLHARSTAVPFPLFTVFRLNAPLPTDGMDGSLVQMRTALVMLLPAEPKTGAAEVMSHISSMIIESNRSKELLEYSDENTIRTFLTRGLKQLLGEITTI